MALTRKREIAADSDMWGIDPNHLEQVLDCQKRIKYKLPALELEQRYSTL